jgi:hypothetical protein
MTREYLNYFVGNTDFLLSLDYYNSDSRTIAFDIDITPIKNIYFNAKGKAKVKELSKGKLYKAILVKHDIWVNGCAQECFDCYVIKNDCGIITKYYEKSIFIDKVRLRNDKLNELLK